MRIPTKIVLAVATASFAVLAAGCSSASTPTATTAPGPVATTVSDPLEYSCAKLDSEGYCPDDPYSPSNEASAAVKAAIKAAATPAKAPATPATQAPAAPAVPAAPVATENEQQALAAAQNYLSDEPGFSYLGLIQQLSSQYGSGFSQSDATYAANNVGANWNQQAVYAAQNYMTTEPGWSCSGMVQQLSSPYGSNFTTAQAEHGAAAVGLGSC
jgi:nucleoid-associated protein YgaU